MKRTIDGRLALRIYLYTFLLIVGLAVRTWAAGQDVGSFTAPLNATLGGSGVSNPTAHTLPVNEGASAQSNVAALTNGQLVVGSTGADPVAATLGTGTGISITAGAGTLQVNNTGVTSAVAGTGISVSGATGAVTISATGGGTRTVTAKTGNYSVVSGDSGTFFDNTGAAGAVNFTLPTPSAGLWFSFYTDSIQTVTVTAPASTTIKLGGSTSAAAGNVTNATGGTCVTLIGISSTQYVATGYTGTWTVN